MDNINVSVLTPSRGRPSILSENFYKMYELAKFPSQVESLIRIDEDDTESIKFFSGNFLKQYSRYVKIFVGPRVGFKYVDRMLKQIASISKGDMIVLASDDCYFVMNHWDEYLLQYKDKEVVTYSKFRLAISRKAYDKFECIRNFSGFSRSERKNKRPLDVLIKKFASRKGIAVRSHKIFGEKSPNDITAQEGRGEKWFLKDLSILDNLPIRELQHD